MSLDEPATRRPRVLVRSLWQTVNIGDVAHAPGVLRAFQRYQPDVEVTLWPRAVDDRERESLRRFLPDVRVVEGTLGDDGHASTDELAAALDTADLLVHGPGAGLVAARDLAVWRRTGKPYGLLGVTVDPLWPEPGGTLDELRPVIANLPPGRLPAEHGDLLSGAAFLFCRDTVSAEYLRNQGVPSGVVAFGPDPTFAFDVRDDDAGERILREHGLGEHGFLCVVPRLRHSPYHRIRGLPASPDDLRRDAVNSTHLDHDLGLLREVVTRWVRSTGLDVLACPEMTYQVELNRNELIAKLPRDVAPKVRLVGEFWTPHEAAAVYARAQAVLSQECHSPILAIAAGTPSLYLRNPTDSVKAQMYVDLGLADRLFEVTRSSADELVTALRAGHADRARQVEHVARARASAEQRLAHMVAVAARTATGGSAATAAGTPAAEEVSRPC